MGDYLKIAVFGLGKVFLWNWKYIDKKRVVCFIDNDKEKIGKSIEGIQVIAPERLNEFNYDAVLLLSLDYRKMKKQLMELGISKSKIFNYLEIAEVIRSPIWIYSNKEEYMFDNWLRRHCDKKRVLLISHELSYSGAPIALMNMARVLQKMGFMILYVSLEDGNLKKELEINNIAYASNWKIVNRDRRMICIKEFDLVVMCTFVLRRLIEECKNIKTPILWWIHEAKDVYYKEKFVDYGDNVSVCCAGKRAQKTFHHYSKNNDTQILQYCIPEECAFEETEQLVKKDRIKLGVIGIISERKGQDILLRAVSQLSSDDQDKIDILMIGIIGDSTYYKRLEVLMEPLENVKIMGEMSQKELVCAYRDIDVLVCPSRDDPMPMVVTQALMYGKPCIVSKNVGQMEFIESGVNGFIFENEEDLTRKLAWIVAHKEKLYDIGKSGRRIYEQNFSEDIMEKKLMKFWQKNCE